MGWDELFEFMFKGCGLVLPQIRELFKLEGGNANK